MVGFSMGLPSPLYAFKIWKCAGCVSASPKGYPDEVGHHSLGDHHRKQALVEITAAIDVSDDGLHDLAVAIGRAASSLCELQPFGDTDDLPSACERPAGSNGG